MPPDLSNLSSAKGQITTAASSFERVSSLAASLDAEPSIKEAFSALGEGLKNLVQGLSDMCDTLTQADFSHPPAPTPPNVSNVNTSKGQIQKAGTGFQKVTSLVGSSEEPNLKDVFTALDEAHNDLVQGLSDMADTLLQAFPGS